MVFNEVVDVSDFIIDDAVNDLFGLKVNLTSLLFTVDFGIPLTF